MYSFLMDRLLENNKIVLAFLICIGFACYAEIANGPFLFDDDLMVVKNKYIRSFGFLGDSFSSGLTQGAYLEGDNFYRPFQAFVHTIIFHFFELNPSPYHIISIIIHIINSFLVFHFLVKFSFSKSISIISTLIFLVHPIQTEAVSYISGLSDPLGLMFLLLGLIQFWHISEPKGHPNRYIHIIWFFLLFIFAVLSKETAVVYLPLAIIILIYRWGYLSKPDRSKMIKVLSVLAGLTVLYLYLKFTVFTFGETIGLTAEKNLYTDHLYIRMISFISILSEYLKMICFPYDLHYEKPYIAFTSINSIQGIIGVMIVLFALYGLVQSFFRRKIVFFGICWFFICLVPVSGIVPLNAIYLEHWLYFPMVGIAILLAIGLNHLNKQVKQIGLISVVVPILIILCVRTIVRNHQWSDAIKFYSNELKYSQTARIYNNLAMEYADQKKHDFAVENYIIAIELRDVYPQSHHNLANSLRDLNRTDEAIKEYYLALRLNPDFIYSYIELYKLFMSIGLEKKAELVLTFIEDIQNGLKISPDEMVKIFTE